MKLLELGLTRKQVFLLGLVGTVLLAAVLMRVVVGPLFLALVITYVLHPALIRLERMGLSRTLQAWLFVGLGCLALFLGVWFLFPLLAAQLKDLALQIPQFREYAENRWLPSISHFLHENVGSIWREARTLSLRDFLPPSLLPDSNFVVASLGRSTRAVIGLALTLILTPIFTFVFIAREKQILRRLHELVPQDLRNQFRPIVLEFDLTLRTVLRSQILVITLLALLYSTAFAAVGMPLGFAVGFLTGIVRLVPYMDLAVGGTLSFFVLATNPNVTPPVILGVLVTFAVIQLLDLAIITPRIMGRFSGIHPFIIILAVLCFADWFGFFGVVLAIPLSAVGRVLLKRFVVLYRGSNFFNNGDHWNDRPRPGEGP